jgi:hypothetical protein
LELMEKSSQESGLSMEETHRMVRLALSMKGDPLPPEKWGERFDFPSSRSSEGWTWLTDWDCLGPVPPPDAEVPLRDAYQRYRSDMENGEAAFKELGPGGLSNTALWAVVINDFDWMVFWSVRHPNEDVRRHCQVEVMKGKAKLARIGELADAALQRRGISRE